MLRIQIKLFQIYSFCFLWFAAYLNTFLLLYFQSEKRKQELLAELAAEEQHGQELTTIVKELLPSPKLTAASERPSRSRRVSYLLSILYSKFIFPFFITMPFLVEHISEEQW